MKKTNAKLNFRLAEIGATFTMASKDATTTVYEATMTGLPTDSEHTVFVTGDGEGNAAIRVVGGNKAQQDRIEMALDAFFNYR